jgi:hypothetical protein
MSTRSGFVNGINESRRNPSQWDWRSSAIPAPAPDPRGRRARDRGGAMK